MNKYYIILLVLTSAWAGTNQNAINRDQYLRPNSRTWDEEFDGVDQKSEHNVLNSLESVEYAVLNLIEMIIILKKDLFKKLEPAESINVSGIEHVNKEKQEEIHSNNKSTEIINKRVEPEDFPQESDKGKSE